MTISKEVVEQLQGVRDEMEDLRRNDEWRERILRLIVGVAIATGACLVVLLMTVFMAVLPTLNSARNTAFQLNDVLQPQTCYGQLSRHLSDLRTWDIKRSFFDIAKIPASDPRYPQRPTPPPKLVSPKCRPLYESFLPNLPH